MGKKVAIVMGSDSDLEIMKKCAKKLDSFGIEWEMRIMSAHRTPKEACEFASNAKANGFGTIVAAAGKAAHLAGVLAAHTTLPVIGVPIKSSTLDGLDALLSTVQMPSGVPVATVAIDGAENAAILSAQILGVYEEDLAKKLDTMKEDMTNTVIAKDKKLQAEGIQ
ncbi:MAG: 5-(carboxyamino)imidazole ribonucleotide mutase [Clostridia bacterium]|nr:5-(carboxyamino)imidazole ribonucleotide mutase [Clostridia bacterium]MBQ6868667.1 5-(carboxyamino)imidazole ribonucleotide mutase [Clostridia bacterium]MBQ6934869.1 5-(carboxyamino)imidazole ribonucleotide mutase [Clostridia bacterium]MBQ7094797.1 5-(carboxyamino)imidazole ribonucleotide mutase [Clostridia bacterium]